MAELRLGEVAEMSGGEVIQGNPTTAFRTYGIDSRLSGPGDLFFAVVGKRDGHDFVSHAEEGGAAGAVVSRLVSAKRNSFAIVRVADTVTALQDLAAGVLRGRTVKIVGITGSVGKTTTKEFLSTLLSPRFQVLKSEGNFNNQLGLPLTALKLEDRHEVAVFEMGMSAPGEIRLLTRIAPPDVSVITNVEPVHLEFFISVEDIAKAKQEILEGTKPGGTAVLNGDDPRVRKMAGEWDGRIITFGLSPGCDVRAENLRTNGYRGMEFVLRIGGERANAAIAFINEAYVMNVLAAAGVGHVFGLSVGELATGIAGLRPVEYRGSLITLQNGIRLYDDSYNSNPRALDAVLKSLGGLPSTRKVAVLGDMLELGKERSDFHRKAGEALVGWKWDVLVAVGTLAATIAEAAAAAGMQKSSIHHFPDSRKAAGRIGGILRKGDLVLVKGSRGMKMEKIVETLKALEKE